MDITLNMNSESSKNSSIDLESVPSPSDETCLDLDKKTPLEQEKPHQPKYNTLFDGNGWKFDFNYWQSVLFCFDLAKFFVLEEVLGLWKPALGTKGFWLKP